MRLGDRFRLIMPDLRGFGRDRPAAGCHGLCDRYADRRHFRIGRCARHRPLRAGRPRLGRRDCLGCGAARQSKDRAAGDRQFAPSADLPEKPDRGCRHSAPPPNIFAHSAIPAWRRELKRWASTTFFEKSFSKHVDLARISAEERQRYIDDWSRPGALDRDAQLVSGEPDRRSYARRERPDARPGSSAAFPGSRSRSASSGDWKTRLCCRSSSKALARSATMWRCFR